MEAEIKDGGYAEVRTRHIARIYRPFDRCRYPRLWFRAAASIAHDLEPADRLSQINKRYSHLEAAKDGRLAARDA